MPTILDDIVAATRSSVAERRVRIPRSSLEARDAFHRVPIDLAASLRREDLAVIAECKRRSPSKGLLRDPYDPLAIAASYETAGAAAVSVLTEPEFFGGSLDDLAAVRGAVGIPLLRKDFVVDPYQLTEARAFGADAVLLIAAVLDRGHLSELHEAATELGLSCLVECYAERELERLDFDRVRIVGVNNRDLHTFVVDRSHAARVLAAVPDSIVRVAESGLRSAADFAAVRRSGLDAVLVGETFMRAADPGVELARLREQTRRLLEQIMSP